MEQLKEKLSFEAVERPIIYKMDGTKYKAETHKAIVNSDTHKILSVMKSSYHPMYNKDFMASVEKMMQISNMDFAGYSELKEGKIVIAHLKNNNEKLEIDGNQIKDYLVMGNSFDGSYPFFIGTTTELLRCQNQFSRINKLEKVRHTKSAPRRKEELFRSLEGYFKQRDQMYENFKELTKVTVDEETRRLAVDYLLGVKEEDRLEGGLSSRKLNQIELLDSRMIQEMNAVGETAWGLLQGTTYYTTHDTSEKTKSAVGFGNIFGRPADINKKALNFCNNLILS